MSEREEPNPAETQTHFIRTQRTGLVLMARFCTHSCWFLGGVGCSRRRLLSLLLLLLLLLLVAVRSFHLGDELRVRLGVLDPLKHTRSGVRGQGSVCGSEAWRPAHHGLVVEGEALQLPQSVGGGGELLEDDEGLPPHRRSLHRHHVQDLTELRQERVEGPLQLCGTRNTQAEWEQEPQAEPDPEPAHLLS